MNRRAPQAVILGIDWGSTSIRASLFFRESRSIHPIWNPGTTPGHDERYQKGAFNSTLYLDDRGDVYLGEDMDQAREPRSSKMYFTKSRQTTNPLIEDAVNQRRGDAGIEDRILKGMKDIMTAVFEGTRKALLAGDILHVYGRCYIDEIALSYPEHWTSEERGTYEGLVQATITDFEFLNRVNDNIVFHEESLAMAHNMFWTQSHITDVLGDISLNDSTLILFLDFGGHAMNGCMFSVLSEGANSAKEEKSDLTYSMVGGTFSAHGGTQLWELETAKLVRQSAREQNWYEKLSPEILAQLLEDFHYRLKRLKSWTPMTLRASGDERNLTAYYCDINQQQMKESFWNALGGPIKLACEKIVEAARIDKRVRVILSGGSGKCFAVQEALRAACDDAKVETNMFLFYENAGDKETWSISKGAAIASSKKVTVEEFIQRGAAFGLQVGAPRQDDGKRQKSYAPDTPYDWDDASELVLDGYGSYPCVIAVKQHHKMRIVCNPLLQAQKDNRWNYVPGESCYNLVEMPKLSVGHWQFTLTLDGIGDDVKLSITQEKVTKSGRAWRVVPNTTTCFSPLPLYFEKSAGCCLLDTHVEDYGRGLALSESGQIVPCGETVVEDQIRNWKDRRIKVTKSKNMGASSSGKKNNTKRKRKSNTKAAGASAQRPSALPPPRSSPSRAELPPLSQSQSGAAASPDGRLTPKRRRVLPKIHSSLAASPSGIYEFNEHEQNMDMFDLAQASVAKIRLGNLGRSPLGKALNRR